MSRSIQLELNIDDKTPEEIQLYMMQKQIEQMHESMGKVRRRLFAELGEMKKLYLKLQTENVELKTFIKELNNETPEWVYGQNNCLFNLEENRSRKAS